MDLSVVGIFKKIRGGEHVGIPDPEEENEESETSDEETSGEEDEDNQAGNADQGNLASKCRSRRAMQIKAMLEVIQMMRLRLLQFVTSVDVCYSCSNYVC